MEGCLIWVQQFYRRGQIWMQRPMLLRVWIPVALIYMLVLMRVLHSYLCKIWTNVALILRTPLIEGLYIFAYSNLSDGRSVHQHRYFAYNFSCKRLILTVGSFKPEVILTTTFLMLCQYFYRNHPIIWGDFWAIF